MTSRETVKITGLSLSEVKERKRAGLDNRPVEAPSKSLPEIIRSNVFTYFNFVFLLIAVVLILIKSYRDLTFLPVIIANALIGIIQEWRAKRVLDKLTVLNAPRARVLREGKNSTIPVAEIVIDDIIRLKAGDQIPIDGVVMEGEVLVNEALLTGEADEIKKLVGDEVMSGSFIVAGECLVKTEKVGAEAYAAKLTLKAKAIKTTEQSEIIRSLDKLVKIIGMVIFPVGLLLFVQQFMMKGLPIEIAVQAMAAAIIGMIPEGLFLLASVTLAISAMRLALSKVLMHDMKSIETLARVDTLCVDKTGTITGERMEVAEFLEFSSEAREWLLDFVRAQKADNATMEALKEYFRAEKSSGKKADKVLAFSSKDKYSGAEFSGRKFVLGAPELILREQFKDWQKKIKDLSKKGYRVLVFGKYGGELRGGVLKAEVEVLGIIAIWNEIRKEAVKTFSYFAEQGVDIKVISGDNPITVSEVARQAGIKGSENYIDAGELLTEKMIKEAVLKYTVFGRVTPEMKRKLIKTLKRTGRTVAMTGDGVNDVLALKDADCSVAMASGASAAVQAAQIVLLESDFAKMPEVVSEGRRVVNNLERSGSLFLVKNIFSVTMAILAIMFGITYPLVPSQVSMVTLFTIGIPSFLLAQIPNHRLIRGNFVKNIILAAAPAGLANVLLIGSLLLSVKILGLPEKNISTVVALVMSVVGLIYLGLISRPFDKLKAGILAVCIAGMTVCITMLGELFRIELAGVDTRVYLVLLGLVILAYPLIAGLDRIFRRFK